MTCLENKKRATTKTIMSELRMHAGMCRGRVFRGSKSPGILAGGVCRGGIFSGGKSPGIFAGPSKAIALMLSALMLKKQEKSGADGQRAEIRVSGRAKYERRRDHGVHCCGQAAISAQEKLQEISDQLLRNPGSVQFTGSTKTQLWAEFLRGLTPAGERGARREKAPPDVVTACSKSLGQKKAWFLRFVCGGTWCVAHAIYEVAEINRTKTRGKCAWLTADQIFQIYHNTAVRDSVVAKCKQNPKQWRYHPFVPECTEAIQYFHEVAQEELHEFEQVVRQGVGFKAEMNPEDAAQLAAKMDHFHGKASSEPTVMPAIADQQQPPLTEEEKAEEAKKAKEKEAWEKAQADKNAKEQQKAETQARDKAERDAKRQVEKDAAQAHKESPEGQAEAWIKDAKKQDSDITLALNGMSGLSKQSRTFFTTQMQAHQKKLNTLKGSMEGTMSGRNSKKLEDLIKTGIELTNQIKEDKLTLNSKNIRAAKMEASDKKAGNKTATAGEAV